MVERLKTGNVPHVVCGKFEQFSNNWGGVGERSVVGEARSMNFQAMKKAPEDHLVITWLLGSG